MKTNDLQVGQKVKGLDLSGVVEIISIDPIAPGIVTAYVKRRDGSVGQVSVSDSMEFELSESKISSFDGNPVGFKLAMEAKRMQLAGVFDPFVALSTSNLQPLPHQLSAVYGELLDRIPLRYLLADEPGAGKTIMAGLLIKELLLRGYLKRCLIVCPGSLSDQWVGELKEKFGLSFQQLTKEGLDASEHLNPFNQGQLIVARMDQLARSSDTVLARLEESEWDLVIVDEAHRMSAQQIGQKSEAKRTKRFKLGQLLSKRTTHFLLMTATPHTGSEENFHLFLSLLDQDMFAGSYRRGETKTDATQLMLRRVKENLVDQDGAKLFPKRIAVSTSYELSELELELYEEVTNYVRGEMAKAMSSASSDKRKQGNISFALTVLQRRLASSPFAILCSLRRRLEKLESLLGSDFAKMSKNDTKTAIPIPTELTEFESEELPDDELEDVAESGILDGVTASVGTSELSVEIAKLRELVSLAEKVSAADLDSKWLELKGILESEVFWNSEREEYEKLIIFTEHRDTLEYLQKKVTKTLLPGSKVITIHGSHSRIERKRAQVEFTNNPDCPILIATDAAGEGINLQKAHLMVNYDLPWNPNRIEQRFGRIHRIGQIHECTLWNLVSSNTREGNVYSRLLEKIQRQDQAYNGNLFHVLGGDDMFEGKSLAELMLEAISGSSGGGQEVDAVIDQAILKAQVSEAEERALLPEVASSFDSSDISKQMNEARARRLAPGFVARFFQEAFRDLGGSLQEKEGDRYKISSVPSLLQKFSRDDINIGDLATKYERITFKPELVEHQDAPTAELVAPGMPLMNALVRSVLDRYEQDLTKGAVFYDESEHGDSEPKLLICLTQDLVNTLDQSQALETVVKFVETSFTGESVFLDVPPYLDYTPAYDDEAVSLSKSALEGVDIPALVNKSRLEFSELNLATRLTELQERLNRRIAKLEVEVTKRLNQEIKFWLNEAKAIAQGSSSTSGTSAQQALSKSKDLVARRELRLAQLQMEKVVVPKDARVLSIALVLPKTNAEQPDQLKFPRDQEGIIRVERRAVELTLKSERALGHTPKEMDRNNKGFDIESYRGMEQRVFIEVKGRVAGAKEFFITDSEFTFGLTQGDNFYLALVKVADGDDESLDEIRYIQNPFKGQPPILGHVAHVLDMEFYWSRGRAPH